MEQTSTVIYRGKEYPLKSFNDYTFATDALYEAMQDPEGERVWDLYEDEETTTLDNRIAFFFSEEEFNKNRPMELLEIYNEYE